MSFSLNSPHSRRLPKQFVRGKKKTIDVFVDGGSFEPPFYNFYDVKGRKMRKFVVDLKKVYRFHRRDDVTSHPFYLSHSGERNFPVGAIKIRGNGGPGDGIIGSEMFSLGFKKRNRKLIKAEGFIQYFCTAHAEMIGLIPIKGVKASQSSLRDEFSDLLTGVAEADSLI